MTSPPLPRTRESLEAAIRAIVAPPHSDAIVAAIEPCIAFRARPCDETDLQLGASRMGGMPDVPVDFEWPWWNPPNDGIEGKPAVRSVDPRPLHFIAQIRLADLSVYEEAHDLPSSGWLLFFYDGENQPWGFDPADRAGARVVHLDCPESSLKRTSGPSSEAFDSVLCSLVSARKWTAPRWPADLPEEFVENYSELMEGRTQLPRHQLLGHPDQIQGDMRVEAQLVSNDMNSGDGRVVDDPRYESVAARAGDWRLLFQVDTDEAGPGWMWGDAGRIFYWIRSDDLAAARFDAAVLLLQCG